MEKMSNFFKLVSVCSEREDILLQIYDGFIVIYVGEGTNRAHMMARCGNEQQCKEFLHEITEGKYAKGKLRTVKTAA